MNKLKRIGLTFLMIGSTQFFAQEIPSEKKQEPGEIIMTKVELESFLKTVADARRAQLRKERDNQNQAYLMELRQKYGQNNRHRGGNGYTDADILRELDRINYRLDRLNGNYNAGYVPNGSNSSTIIVPGSNGNGTAYLPSQQGTQYVPVQQAPVNYADNNRAIWELERKIDSLKAIQNGFKTVIVQPKSDSIQMADLQRQLQELQSRLSITQDPVERRSLLEELLANFKNFKKQVFFANNSEKLNSNDYAYIEDVAGILKQYPELSVVLEGWASPRGNADYNKQLSMRRAEAVERALLDKGISPARIVSSFRGEDNSTSEAMARRVDMTVILK